MRGGRNVAIIGGGLSGLAAAWRLIESGHDLAITVFESRERLGGLIETVQQDGFLIERGADSFITTKPAAVSLCERLGIADELIAPVNENRRSLIVHEGRPVATPNDFHLIVPRSVQAILDAPLLSTAGKLRFLQEANVARGDGRDESLASFTRRRFGDEFLTRLVQPITAGIYSADPDELSMAASLPQFLAMEQQHGSLIAAGRSQRDTEREIASGARYGLFATFPEGMGRLVDVLSDHVHEHAVIRTQTPVTAVTQASSRWQIHIEDRTEEFDAVLLALPARVSASLVRGLNLGPVEAIPTATSAIVVTGHRVSDVSHPLDAFGMVVPFVEQRPVTAVSFASRKFPNRAPDEHVLVRTFIGGPHGQSVLASGDDVLVQTAQKQLEDLLGVTGDPVATLVTRYPNASPQYTLGHLERVAEIETAVARHDGLELAGASYRGVGIPDAIASGEAAAERLLGTFS